MRMMRDPVCGMMVPAEGSVVVVWEGSPHHFCSSLCLQRYQQSPTSYAAPGRSVGERRRRIAYFSMEIGLLSSIPTYSGGLGVLAGDMLRSCADLGLAVVGVTLLYRSGNFHQTLDDSGQQHEWPEEWRPENHLRRLPVSVSVPVGSRGVVLRLWQFDVVGIDGFVVPVLLLDADHPDNAPEERSLTERLYGGDEGVRFRQEILLGIGGLRALRALGYDEVERFHLNEGHASLLTLELLRERRVAGDRPGVYDRVRERCIFTTHTPVAAGHDTFDYDWTVPLLTETASEDDIRMLGGADRLHMTLLGVNLSQFVNGVARRHTEIVREMFPIHAIESVTNGVHAVTWTSAPFQALYDRHIPAWRSDPFSLRGAVSIPLEEIEEAHTTAKGSLISRVRDLTGQSLDPRALTIGFARRATEYKRTDLLLNDVDAVRSIARDLGPLQVLFSGKAHPSDEAGKAAIRRVVDAARRLSPDVTVLYLPDYSMELATLLVAGADVWLNTPQPPLEASGTSGMKAALNGVPSWSVLDGWWIEGHIEGITGWSIGSRPDAGRAQQGAGQELADLYGKLRHVIAPLFFQRDAGWSNVMRQTIAINAAHFHTHRMVQQYAVRAYV